MNRVRIAMGWRIVDGLMIVLEVGKTFERTFKNRRTRSFDVNTPKRISLLIEVEYNFLVKVKDGR